MRGSLALAFLFTLCSSSCGDDQQLSNAGGDLGDAGSGHARPPAVHDASAFGDAGQGKTDPAADDAVDAGHKAPMGDAGPGAADAGSFGVALDGGLAWSADASAPPGFADAGSFFPHDAGPQLDFSDLFQPPPPDGGVLSPITLESRRLAQSYPTPCGPPIARGQVLHWVAPQAGTLRVNVSSTSAHRQLLQVDCGSLTTTKACAPDAKESELLIAVEESQQLCWLLGFEGEASVLATFAPAVCGDGVVNSASEQCDFGDQLSGDGCDSNCQFEVATANDGDTCPGVAQSVIDQVTVNGFTVGYSDQAPATCNALPSGSDKHHLIIPNRSGRLKLDLTADFDAVLSVFTSCDMFLVSDLLACSDGPRADAIESLEIPVTEKKHYYVAIDGYAPKSFGAYTLSMTLTPDLELATTPER